MWTPHAHDPWIWFDTDAGFRDLLGALADLKDDEGG
jgi:hypothetical protein